MSCQQVPRLTEDPYTFTETTPVTATLFNPQVHKLTPIITSPVGTLKPTISQRVQQSPAVQQTLRGTSSQPQFHQLQNQRINGLTALVNGVHKNVIVNTSSATITKLSPHLQQHQQQIKITTNPPTKKFLPPPSPSPATITIHQSHPLYSIAKQNSVISPAQLSTVLLPPLFQRNTPTAQTVVAATSSVTPSTGTGVATVTQTTKPSPPIVQHVNAINAIQQNKNHSSVNKLGTVVNVRTSQPIPNITAGLSNCGSQVTAIAQNAALVQVAAAATQPIMTISSRKSGVPAAPTSLPVVTSLTTPTSTTTAPAKKFISQPQSVTKMPMQTVGSGDSAAKPSPESIKRKSLDSSDHTVFVTPAKRDSRVSSASTGKKSAKVQSSPSARTRRSYSQSTHHEALQRIPPTSTALTSNVEWHAPDSYIFDCVFPASSTAILENFKQCEISPCVQSHWLSFSDMVTSIPMSTQVNREQRIEFRKAHLRRQAMQYIASQRFRSSLNAKRRLVCVSKSLQKLRDRDDSPATKKCCFPSCTNDPLALTAHCYLHITRNTDQHLFLPCTAKFSDNSQCRVPVFDISHELPLCREHAWKRDNYNRIVQELKPKKSPRKRPKQNVSRPQKRNKKKRKPLSQIAHGGMVGNSHHSVIKIGSGTTMITKMGYQIRPDDGGYIIAQPAANATINTAPSFVTAVTQDMLGICENSSAYESSEDTGVGGLSETELMVGAHDVIEEIPLGDTRLLEEHDLTNVLNQLPEDAFNELFTTVQQNGPLEPTQEEQEDLERALEAVNKQVKSLQQLTGGDSTFLTDFLDVDDQILEDSDICTEVLHSPDDDDIETGSIIVSGGESSNGITSTTTADIRGLVQT